MTSFAIKLTALIAMFIDHTGDVFARQSGLYIWMRGIGRLAFPIYCFLLVEGYHHTADVRKYLGRLGVFAVISEIPFDLCFEGKLMDATHQNVYFTLFLGLLMLVILERIPEIPLKLVVATVFCLAAQELHCDYRYIGILMIIFFEYYRRIVVMRDFTQLMCNIRFSTALQGFGIFALIPIHLYNGKKGPSMKYFFYAAYPVHLLIIYFIAVYRGIY